MNCPIFGEAYNWTEGAKLLNIVCEASVSDLLERKAGEEERAAGYDLADYFTAPRPAPQEAPQRPEPAPADTQPQQPQETPTAAPEEAPAGQIPGCFSFYPKPGKSGQQGLEYKGLPMPWLNDEEQAEAQKMMQGIELEIMQRINPNLVQLVERFDLIPEQTNT